MARGTFDQLVNAAILVAVNTANAARVAASQPALTDAQIASQLATLFTAHIS